MILHIPCRSSNGETEIVTGEDITDLVDNQNENGILIYLPCDNDEIFDGFGG